MRVALAVDDERIAEHFGHCSHFLIFDIENVNITNEQSIANPGHQPGYLPVFLKEKGVNLVIAGGMGLKAKEIFTAQGIEAVTGVNLSIREAIEAFKRGLLKGTGETCIHPEGHNCHND